MAQKTSLTASANSEVLIRALDNTRLGLGGGSSLLFYDLDLIDARLAELQRLFPEDTLHAVAAKANPLLRILEGLRQGGAGLEVASSGELALALKAGFAASNIVFDSPAKTIDETARALDMGICLNADSFEELGRIARLLGNAAPRGRIGVRINPQVGSGSILSTSVATDVSKFGIPLNDHRDDLIRFFIDHPWLTGVHLHIGSQGCALPLMVKGVRRVLDFALEINQHLAPLQRRIDTFDLGGGLPVTYHPDYPAPSMADYVQALRETCPELFNGSFRLITEFGRCVHANAGLAATKVEYVKREAQYNILMTHLGADYLLRKCYNPADWHHEISVCDPGGRLKTGEEKIRYIVAGPLCFAGDIIERDVELPEVEAGDYLLIHDTGAYTLSMWSRYNSRPMPAVLGYRKGGASFEILKAAESNEDLVRFWS